MISQILTDMISLCVLNTCISGAHQHKELYVFIVIHVICVCNESPLLASNQNVFILLSGLVSYDNIKENHILKYSLRVINLNDF